MMSERGMEPRVEYDELKSWIFEGLYADCRTSFRSNALPFNLLVSLSSIADSYDGVFGRVVENFMIAVIFSILGAGVEDRWLKVWRDKVESILAKHSIEELLIQLTEKERFDILADLRALRLVSST